MKIVIVSAGTPPSIDLLKTESIDSSYVIAADGGSNCLNFYNFLPSMAIGDMDSVDQFTMNFLNNNKIALEVYPKNKDCTDTELCLNKAILLGATKIVFLGCTGGIRIDHLLGNIGLLSKCLDKNIEATIKDDASTIAIFSKSFKMNGKKNELFSLIAYNSTILELSIIGAKFELSNYNLEPESSLAISNEFLGAEVEVSFKNGRLLVIRERSHW